MVYERKVVVLGGGGAMARPAARILVGRPDVAELVIADRDGTAAERAVADLTDEFGSTTGTVLRATVIDVTDVVALGELLRDVDLVLNTAGPFFRLGVSALRAAIDARTHYVDICDDPEPTVAMLAMDAQARAAGITAVVGAGASPGASNLLAALALNRLDTVDDVYTAWPVDVGFGGDGNDEIDGAPSAAVVHWMQQLSGTVEVRAHGLPVQVRPLKPVSLDYPGRGRGTGYVVGHPEPVTMPRTRRISGDSSCLMIVTAGTAAYLMTLRDDIDRGALTLKQAAHALAAPTTTRAVRTRIRALTLAGPGNLPPFFALARGRRDGHRSVVGAQLRKSPSGMANATGVPLALIAGQVLDGTVDVPGVHPPDAVVDPRRFFAELARYCDPPGVGLDDVVRIDEATSTAR